MTGTRPLRRRRTNVYLAQSSSSISNSVVTAAAAVAAVRSRRSNNNTLTAALATSRRRACGRGKAKNSRTAEARRRLNYASNGVRCQRNGQKNNETNAGLIAKKTRGRGTTKEHENTAAGQREEAAECQQQPIDGCWAYELWELRDDVMPRLGRQLTRRREYAVKGA